MTPLNWALEIYVFYSVSKGSISDFLSKFKKLPITLNILAPETKLFAISGPNWLA